MKHDDTIEEKVPPEGAEMGEQASEDPGMPCGMQPGACEAERCGIKNCRH